MVKIKKKNAKTFQVIGTTDTIVIQVQIGILKYGTNGKTMIEPNVIDEYQCYINTCILVVSFLLISIRIRKTSEETMIFVNISLML